MAKQRVDEDAPPQDPNSTGGRFYALRMTTRGPNGRPWSHETVARFAGPPATREAVSKVERNINKLTGGELRRALAKAFAVPLESFIDYLKRRIDLAQLLKVQGQDAPRLPRPASLDDFLASSTGRWDEDVIEAASRFRFKGGDPMPEEWGDILDLVEGVKKSHESRVALKRMPKVERADPVAAKQAKQHGKGH